MTIVHVMRCVSKLGEQVYSPLFCMEGSGSPGGERDEGGRSKLGVGLEGQRGKGSGRWGDGKGGLGGAEGKCLGVNKISFLTLDLIV